MRSEFIYIIFVVEKYDTKYVSRGKVLYDKGMKIWIKERKEWGNI